MRRATLALVPSVFLSFFATSAWAGAWNQNAGEGQVIVTSGWYHASSLYPDPTVVKTLLGYTKIESRVWAEVGLSRDVTLVANGGYQTIDYRDTIGDIAFEGRDDLELGLQWQLHRREGIALSLRASYILDSDLDDRFPDVNSNGDAVELRVLLGQSRETLMGDVFHDTQLAIRSDGNAEFDSAYATTTLGYKPTHRTLFMLQGFADHAVNRSDTGDRTQITSQLSSQLSVVYQFKPGRYAQFGGKLALAGRNAVKDRALIFGVWTEY